MNVFILAGGLGTRIRSLFPNRPKPLIPVNGKPFLEWQIEILMRQGFRSFVFCVGYLSEQIIDYFGDGSTWNIGIEYSIETEPLGTAGALKHAARHMDGTSIVLNGDTYFSTDYRELVARHWEHVQRDRALASVALVWSEDTARYGRVNLNPVEQILGFEEKSFASQAGYINAGAYVVEPDLLHYIPSHKAVSIERETFPMLASTHVRLTGLPVQGAFVDMGTPDGYARLRSWLQRDEYVKSH